MWDCWATKFRNFCQLLAFARCSKATAAEVKARNLPQLCWPIPVQHLKQTSCDSLTRGLPKSSPRGMPLTRRTRRRPLRSPVERRRTRPRRKKRTPRERKIRKRRLSDRSIAFVAGALCETRYTQGIEPAMAM